MQLPRNVPIKITAIPHYTQKYDTIGDYFFEDGVLNITVSDTGNEYYNYLIAFHEFVEFILTKKRGISIDEMTDFNLAFQSNPNADYDESGWDPHAPNHNEHVFAEYMERKLAGELGIKWRDYEDALKKFC